MDLISYGSRIAEMSTYSTIYNTLKSLATHEASITQDHARDKTLHGFLQFDNVQNYTRQRDHHVGRTNKMNIGIAATYCELEGIDIDARDLQDRRKRIVENKRTELTVEQLLGMIDQHHLDTVYSFHWLRILVNSIPELSHLKSHVLMLFKSKAAKLQLSVQPTTLHPLASSGKNETVTTELKDALFDFLAQMGHTNADHDDRIVFAGGDGLTFQKMLELQRYLQFHHDPFQSLEILEPVLSLWHTEWTDLSRVFKTHWGNLMSMDPSTLGHSASKINRPSPTNLKKVDYYTAAELMYLILETRMLDCWRSVNCFYCKLLLTSLFRNHFKCSDIFDHFKTLADKKVLPEIEDLITSARQLPRTFLSTRAISFALDNILISSEWSELVPLGSQSQSSKVVKKAQIQDVIPKFPPKVRLSQRQRNRPDLRSLHDTQMATECLQTQ